MPRFVAAPAVVVATLAAIFATPAEAKTALLLIDVQDCFTSSGSRTGSLSVDDAIDIVPIINQLRAEKSCLFDEVFMSRDYHPLDHISFASTHGISFSNAFDIASGTNTIQLKCLNPTSGATADASCCLMDTAACSAHGCTCTDNPACSSNSANQACSRCAANASECFDMTQALWPDHCGSWNTSEPGSDSSFVSTLDLTGQERVVRKGGNQLVDAYSAFMDNTKTLKTELDSELRAAGVDTLFLAGIATDFCVSWTAQDAIDLGYSTTWISDASKGIVSQTLSLTGLQTVTSSELLAMDCPVGVISGQGRAGLDALALGLVLLAFHSTLR